MVDVLVDVLVESLVLDELLSPVTRFPVDVLVPVVSVWVVVDLSLVRLVIVELMVASDDEVPDCWNEPEILLPELLDDCWETAVVDWLRVKLPLILVDVLLVVDD